jgi:hypothetical protein
MSGWQQRRVVRIDSLSYPETWNGQRCAYGHAWENRNPEAATALFAENGTYQVTPFLKPMCGRKAIFE